MIKAILLLALISSALAIDKIVYRQWKSHIAKYNRKFQSEEESRKSYANFARNLAEVNEHNRKFALGLETYEKGLNQLSDLDFEKALPQYTGLDFEEFQKEFSNLNKRSIKQSGKDVRGITFSKIQADANLPASVDHSKYVVNVKNQLTCGSCYAHAAASTAEARTNMQFGEKVSLSVQQIIDCTYNATTGIGNFGCNGGGVTNTFSWMASATLASKALLTEAQAPYTVGSGTYKASVNCNNAKSISTYNYRVKTYQYTDIGDIQAIKTVLRDGPAFCMVLADASFMAYKSGIYTNKNYTVTKNLPNHAIVLLGYGSENGVDYFILQNSWATSWGDKGFMKIETSSSLINYMCTGIIMEKIL